MDKPQAEGATVEADYVDVLFNRHVDKAIFKWGFFLIHRIVWDIVIDIGISLR